jgi:predicted transcriptional regulator
MTIERVSVSLPSDVRQAAQKLADATGVPFSTIVSESLSIRLRGIALDEWLADVEASHGGFTEEELRETAQKFGVPYVLPTATEASAA